MAKELVRFASLFIMLTSAALSPCAHSAAGQIDIAGPPGSVAFGTSVTVLPNGNMVITDPSFRDGRGAVHLYRPNGTRISTLFGNRPGDQVGSEGVLVLANGNFLVLSMYWSNGPLANAGAVTWVDGARGLSGAVSSNNSLVGSSTGDNVGYAGVIALSNGNYVVASTLWSNGELAHVGAATWGNGATGTSGPVSTENSLVGSTPGDGVGGFYRNKALPNGNYVIDSLGWSTGSAQYAGAVTWGNGTTGTVGTVSPSNSLVGSQTYDFVGREGVAVLANGNYVVSSSWWNNGDATSAGAATWADGNTGIAGVVSADNSLVGTMANDSVSGSGPQGITALPNGNYVVCSPGWNHGTGAATWADGRFGITGMISPDNSLVGGQVLDGVGAYITALTNGNYVVGSPGWSPTPYPPGLGAATLGNGSTGTVGVVSELNSLVGSRYGDSVGRAVTALANGNYVVSTQFWSASDADYWVGAVTWGDGSAGVTGPVSAANSLVGMNAMDQVGFNGVLALKNGNYVVSSSRWSNAGVANAGAVTWGSGTAGIRGPVSPENSLVGAIDGDYVGYFQAVALSNGNFVAQSYPWNNGAAANAGAVTWGNGATGIVGALSPANSLVGDSVYELVGYYVDATEDGNYIVSSPGWSTGATPFNGAVTLVNGAFRSTGVVGPENSVVGTAANQGAYLSHAYDATRKRLVVGRPLDNMISLWTLDQVFADGFEP